MFRLPNKRLWFSLAAFACLLGLALLLVAYTTTPRTSDVLPAATATQALPTIATAAPTLAATDTPPPAFAFGTLGAVTAIQIVDDYDWVFGHTFRHYTLHRSDYGFEGQAEFTYSYYGPPELHATRHISFSQRDTQNFFQQLMAVVSQEPLLNPPTIPPSTDQYRTLSIEMDGSNDSIKIKSRGSADFNRFDIDYGGHQYTIESLLTRETLDTLKPLLREDVLNSFAKHETPAP